MCQKRALGESDCTNGTFGFGEVDINDIDGLGFELKYRLALLCTGISTRRCIIVQFSLASFVFLVRRRRVFFKIIWDR